MSSYEQGGTAPLSVEFFDAPGGNPIAVSALTIEIAAVGGATIFGPTGAGIANPDTGVYTFIYTVPIATVVGFYTVTWAGLDPSLNAISATEVIAIVTPGGSATTIVPADHYGPAEWWYPDGTPAANAVVRVYPENQSIFSPIFSDAALTVPMANPTTTDSNGLLEFYAADGFYWIFVGQEAHGDSVLIQIETTPDPGFQPLSTIEAKGDLYAGTADNATTRRSVGTDGEVLRSLASDPTGLDWFFPTQTLIFTDDRNVLTAGAGLARLYNRFGLDLVIVGAWASAGVQPTGAAILADVNINGTTIYTAQGNRPTVPAASNGGAISATPDVTAFAQGDYLTIDIDQIGSTIPGGLLTVGVVVRYA